MIAIILQVERKYTIGASGIFKTVWFHLRRSFLGHLVSKTYVSLSFERDSGLTVHKMTRNVH